MNPGSPENYGAFAGFDNYAELFSSENGFWPSIGRTGMFSSICLLIEIPLGMMAAIYLSTLRDNQSRAILSFFIIPMVLAPIVVGLIWYFQYNPTFGPLSYYTDGLLGEKATFLDSRHAFYSIIAIDVWEYTPFITLIVYSGIKAIPKNVLDAAHLDRIPFPIRFRKIILGYIFPVLLVAILLRLIGLIKSFDTIYSTTGGGPGEITEVFSTFAHRTNFRKFNWGVGAAQGIVFNYLFLGAFWIIFKRGKIYKKR
jgi:multiple sugar transport system permease protein